MVARFLALLELYRKGLVGVRAGRALGELTVRWTGGETVGAELDIDEYEGTPPPPEPAESPPSESVTDADIAALAGDAPDSDVSVDDAVASGDLDPEEKP